MKEKSFWKKKKKKRNYIQFLHNYNEKKKRRNLKFLSRERKLSCEQFAGGCSLKFLPEISSSGKFRIMYLSFLYFSLIRSVFFSLFLFFFFNFFPLDLYPDFSLPILSFPFLRRFLLHLPLLPPHRCLHLFIPFSMDTGEK